MVQLYETAVATDFGRKKIEVFNGNILEFPETIDVLAVSAFIHCYNPTRGTVLGALNEVGVSVLDLAAAPEIDLRSLCNVWLSRHTQDYRRKIRRIGCIEFKHGAPQSTQYTGSDQSLLNSLKAFFQMLDIASIHNIPIKTVALPLLGAGNQNISASILLIPILNECISFLRRNADVERICFVEWNYAKSQLICDALRASYTLSRPEPIVPCEPEAAPRVFISYSSHDRKIADILCRKLEDLGVRVWYAPRDVQGPYAAAIANAIDAATSFVVILSAHSVVSEHVLNEVDLAFQKLPKRIRFHPLRIDSAPLSPSMNYYLSRQHWIELYPDTLEPQIEKFAAGIAHDR